MSEKSFGTKGELSDGRNERKTPLDLEKLLWWNMSHLFLIVDCESRVIGADRPRKEGRKVKDSPLDATRDKARLGRLT